MLLANSKTGATMVISRSKWLAVNVARGNEQAEGFVQRLGVLPSALDGSPSLRARFGGSQKFFLLNPLRRMES